MEKRIDPNPDPFAKQPVTLTRQPGRAQPKSVAVDSTRPVDRMRAHVHSSGTQSIPDTTPTIVTFSVTDFDSVGLFTANKFTIPSTGKITGPWYIHSFVTFAAAAAGARHLHIRKNGSTILVDAHEKATNDEQTLDAHILINDPIAGDFYEMVVVQDSGAPLNITKAAEETFFEIIHLY